MKQNKTTKYFKYAIGEIVLVVIGILIALQLNTWKEANVERKVEKAYIVSLIEDLKKDSNNFSTTIDLNEVRMKNLDSFASMCFNYKENNDSNFLTMYLASIKYPDFVSQTDRTLVQLRNAGGMRLITKKITADSIVQYEDYFSRLTNQQVWYEDMLKDLVNAGILIFNYKYLPRYKEKWTKERLEEFNRTAKIETKDIKGIIALGNTAIIYKGITEQYLALLEEGKQKSQDLINVLQTDYEISNK
ncbi:MAG: DUF6090 family protein [Oceanihabitans sp.]